MRGEQAANVLGEWVRPRLDLHRDGPLEPVTGQQGAHAAEQPGDHNCERERRPGPKPTVPRSQSFATAAFATSSSCCDVPPPTPHAPSTTPFLMIGTAPMLGIMWPPSAATMPWMIGVTARSVSSPLARPKATDAIALPCEP